MKKIIISVFIIAFAQLATAQDTYWSITWEMSIPTGPTQDFIEKSSFRGFGFEGRKFVDNNVSIGGGIHWNVFYEKKDKITTVVDNITLTGTHFNYINAFPFFFNASWYMNEGSYVRPYVGLNAGGIYAVYRKDIGLYRIEEDPLKLGLAPEIGVMVDAYTGMGFTINARYNYGLQTSETDALNYFGINVGLLWSY
ncbi:MAG: outer membrane beta-barrel protein [Bacteroidales bacterium]